MGGIVREFFVAVACWLAVVSSTSGATIVTDASVEFWPIDLPNGKYVSRVDQDVFGDYTDTWFEFTIDVGGYFLRVTQWNIDEEADWYLVDAGDSFSKEAIAANKFTPLFTTDHAYPAVNVSPYPATDFYLGVNTGINLPDYREAFGWVHFRIVNGVTLTMVDNVMSYHSPGIVVGTTQLVPEPAACHLLLVGMLSILKLRSR